MTGIALRRLTGADAATWRALRLEALRGHPEAFGAALEDEAERPVAAVAALLDRAPPDAVFGAFGPGGGSLLGAAGMEVMRGAKQRHKALLWGLHVRPDARGQGLARALVAAVVAAARAAGIEQLQLGVGEANAAALALYRGAGFQPYGIERGALRLGPGTYVDEVLMALDLRAPPGPA